MKKLILLSLAVCFSLALSSPALALRWPDNMSYRVGTMGGATLAIEDETTALTIFNHQNHAGVALNKKENRSDLGLTYRSTNEKTEYTTFTREDTTTGMELERPGAEYRGMTYWLDDSLVIRAGIEGLMMSGKTTITPIVGSVVEEGLGFSGLGGGASISYLFDGGFAIGGGASYIGAGGKPDDLTGAYNVYAGFGGTTSKVEMSASVLSWGVGLGYEIPGLGGDENKLTLGVGVHSDDDRPNVSGLADAATGGSVNPQDLGDYSVTFETEGTVGGAAATNSTTYSQAPFFISAEAIFNVGSMLEAGLLFDYGMNDINEKDESTNFLGTLATDYKVASVSELGITPIVKANIPIGEDMALLPGASLTTWGSGTMDMFDLDPTTPAVSDSYKSGTLEVSSSLIGIGCGLQAMGKQLQVGVQLETGGTSTDSTPYAIDGTAGTVSTLETGISNIRIGAEYWVIPMLAIRAGFASLGNTNKDVYTGIDPVTLLPIYEDVTASTSRITFGLGVSLPEGMVFNLLVGLNTNTTSPASDPEPSDTAMDILLGAKLPI